MLLHRRDFLRTAGAGLLAAALPLPGGFARAAAPFTQPPLPYDEGALAPVISAKTVGLHYGKHHKGYFDTLNRLVEGTPFAAMTLEQVVKESAGKPEHQKIFNNAGQAWNHVVYWEQMKPGGSPKPSGRLAEAIERDFGGFDAFKDKLTETATGVFGSGWAWLVEDGGKLALLGTSNADNPLAKGGTALLGIDVWEHAYYLDYQNRRKEHVQAVLDRLVNWDRVGERLGA